jgi:hypothetical protein
MKYHIVGGGEGGTPATTNDALNWLLVHGRSETFSGESTGGGFFFGISTYYYLYRMKSVPNFIYTAT